MWSADWTCPGAGLFLVAQGGFLPRAKSCQLHRSGGTGCLAGSLLPLATAREPPGLMCPDWPLVPAPTCLWRSWPVHPPPPLLVLVVRELVAAPAPPSASRGADAPTPVLGDEGTGQILLPAIVLPSCAPGSVISTWRALKRVKARVERQFQAQLQALLRQGNA